MQAKIETDVVSYRAQVERFAKLTGISLQEAMQEGVSVMSGQLVKKFFPRTRSHGLKSIKNDINRVIITDADVMLTGQIDGDRHMLVFASGANLAVDQRFFKPSGSASDLRAHHESQRVTRRRRTVNSRPYYRKGLKHIDKMYVPASAAKAYIKQRQQESGKVKARWSAGAVRWKGSAKLPAWISKHSEKGRVNDRMKRNGNGFIEIINTTPYASEWQDINNHVVRSQSRMFQNRIRGVLRKRAKEQERRRAA